MSYHYILNTEQGNKSDKLDKTSTTNWTGALNCPSHPILESISALCGFEDSVRLVMSFKKEEEERIISTSLQTRQKLFGIL